MVINILLLIAGILFLFFGIKNKLKFWIAAGVLILCLGAVSVYMDCTAPGTDGIDGSRVPFVVGHFMN